MAEGAELKLGNLTVADEADLKLFTSKFSPYGQRVAIALKEKKIPFQTIEVDFANKPQEFLEANPIHKKVPAIIHKGKPVAESLVILEYLEDAFPEQVPLMPKDAYEKSKFRFWIDYIYKAFTNSRACLITKPGSPEKEAAIQGALKSLKTLEQGMISFSAEGPFFAGEKFGMMDLALAPMCYYGSTLQEVGGMVTPGPDQLPRFHKWLQAVEGHPSVSSTVPPADETLAYVKSIVAKMAAAAAAGGTK